MLLLYESVPPSLLVPLTLFRHASVNPQNDPEAVGDPYKTLFISRLNYEATEEDLRREFNMYGPIERIRLVREESGKNKGKSRGYAFILYEREKDMKGGSILHILHIPHKPMYRGD